MLANDSAVVLRHSPGRLRPYAGVPGEIVRVFDEGFADVAFDGSKPVCVPLAYLEVVREKLPRRSPLNLTGPKDNRTEAQRMADGIAELEQRGYGVLRVGQSRTAAICHKCSRVMKQMVRIVCATCGSLGYSPSTNSTKGTPDSFVFHEEWPRWAFLGMEWKDGERGQRTPEQVTLERQKRIVVVWSTETALAAVEEFEARLGIRSLMGDEKE